MFVHGIASTLSRKAPKRHSRTYVALPFVILRQAALAAQTGGPSGARERDTVEGAALTAEIAFGAAGSPGLRFAAPEDDGRERAG
ncbi:hypothetical protein D3C71_1693340 [compost metagenome]